jgi:hypothetical protein
MAVPVKTGEKFEAGVPISLFKINPVIGTSWVARYDYDVTADGQRFLVSSAVGEARSLPFTVVVNWNAGLKR